MTTINAEHFHADQVPLSLANYTVTLRNGTTTRFDEVVTFFKRRNLAGVTFSGYEGLAPGEIVVTPLGAATDLISYTIGLFVNGVLVARVPQAGGEMTPQLASQLDPNRLNGFTDAWVVEGRTLLPLDQYMYQVAVRNDTPDKWDEVALFYGEKGVGTKGVSRPNVEPGSTASLPLCRCDKMEGYSFAVFVDGLAANLEGDQPRFPAQGLMTARRSMEYHLRHGDIDLDACGDLWIIG